MSAAERQDSQEQIVHDITLRAGRAMEAGHPLFLIVYYEHEARKIGFLKTLAQALRDSGLGSQTFDPVQRPEHGAGFLYPLLAATAASRTLALITGIPRPAASSDHAVAFLDYLNLHRDRIERDKLRLVLFLHSSEAERFMAGAGDLWDFRHHTYWLEGMPSTDLTVLWSSLAATMTTTALSEQDKEAIATHLQNTRTLIEQTPETEEKASLFLGLSQWLRRHHIPTAGAEAALTGLHLLDDSPTLLRANLEHELGYALRESHNYSDALRHYERSLVIRHKIGDRAGEGATLNNISQIYDVWGRYDEALQALEQSLIICREFGNLTGEGTTLNNISQIYKAQGRYDEALKGLEQSLVIYRKIGNLTGEGTTLNNISQIYKAQGRYDEAMKGLEQSLAICREIGNRTGEGATLNNISQIYQAWGRYDEALQGLEQSLAISREIGNRAGEGATLNNISTIYLACGRHDEALQTLKESLVIRREIGDRAGESTTLNNISQIFQAWGHYDQALQALMKSQAICREIGDKTGEGTTLNNISLTYCAWGRYDEALQALKQSLFIHREIGDKTGEVTTCWNLAVEYKRRGDLARAIEFARKTVEIEEELHHPHAPESREFLRQLEQKLAASPIS